MVIGRDEIHNCFNCCIDQFGKQNQGYRERQQYIFKRREPEEKGEQQNSYSSDEMIAEVPLAPGGPENALNGTIQTFQPVLRLHGGLFSMTLSEIDAQLPRKVRPLYLP